MSDVNLPLILERGRKRLTQFRVFDKKPDFFVLLIQCRGFRPDLPTRGIEIGMNDDPVDYASISLKNIK
jgi:hypothetical protein